MAAAHHERALPRPASAVSGADLRRLLGESGCMLPGSARRHAEYARACLDVLAPPATDARGRRAPEPTPACRRGELVAGRYRVLDRLGRGGMASVWLALDNALSRP